MKKSKLRNIIRQSNREMHEPGHMGTAALGAAPPNMLQPNISHEHNKEGKMAKYDSLELSYDAEDVYFMIQDNTNLPEWVEAKITLAADYMNTVKDYLSNHMQLQERIGFRGPDYADETKDLFSDFQSSVEMLNKEFKEKSIGGDSAEVQEILTTLDDTLSPEFIENLDTILSLIRELPDKPEKQKIGFK